MRKLNHAIDRFCLLHPSFGVPRFYLYLIICNVALFVLTSFSSSADIVMNLLGFSLSGLLHGRIWQLVTFVLLPKAGGTLSFLLSCYCTYWIGTALERQWGTAKLTVYYLCGMMLSILGTVLFSVLSGWNILLYSVSDISFAMFIAYALFYPDAQIFLIPFPIPIRARYLAYFDILLFLVEIFDYIRIGYWPYSIIPLMALINVFIFVWPEAAAVLNLETKRARQSTHFHNTVSHARQQENHRRQTQNYQRKCAVCGRTDVSNPELQFRYCSQCAGYHCFCSDHIFSHVHFTDDAP